MAGPCDRQLTPLNRSPSSKGRPGPGPTDQIATKDEVVSTQYNLDLTGSPSACLVQDSETVTGSMAASRFRRQHLMTNSDPPFGGTATEWQSLSDLGRPYGLSALQIGRLLIQSELRESSGEPTFRALAKGLARRLPAGQHHPVSGSWRERICCSSSPSSNRSTSESRCPQWRWVSGSACTRPPHCWSTRS